MPATPETSASVSQPRRPVAILRERVDGLMQLAARREALLSAVLPAGRDCGPAAPAGPSDTEVARLSDAVSRLQIKCEGLAREVQRAQRDLGQHESQLAKPARVPERRPDTGAQGAPAAQERQARSQQPGPVPPRHEAASLPEPLSPEATALRQAQQQLAEAKRKLSDAETLFDKAKAAATRTRESALAEAAKQNGYVDLVQSFAGWVHCMENKIRDDGKAELEKLGLPPVQQRSGMEGHKDALLQEFQAFRDGLTEPGADGGPQFRAIVKEGLPKLMAFDALVRTHLPGPVDSLGITACHRYRERHPDPESPIPAFSPEVAAAMAKLALDSLSAGWEAIDSAAQAKVSGRQKIDKWARQSGASASQARQFQELRMKDASDLGERARLLQALLKDNRSDLEHTLTGFMYTGLLGLHDQPARFRALADAAQKRADAPDPKFAERMMAVAQARKAVKQAEAALKELPDIPSLRRDPPGPGAAAVPARTMVPQLRCAAPGPGLARDPETRSTKQRGRMLGLETLRDGARQHLGEVSTALRGAEDTLQKAREELDAALVSRAQADQAARQNMVQQRALRSGRATRQKELEDLDKEIKAARADLCAEPALQSLIAPRALERVIALHVDPDDEALRERALNKTGLNGRYDSVEHMAEAVADVHVAALGRFPQLFAARTPEQFEQAAQAHPSYDAALKALVNIPHEHGRLVGQGYDAKIDRTERLIPLTRSEYGLAWCGDRVMVSHLHPGVPRRTLRTLDSPPRNPE